MLVESSEEENLSAPTCPKSLHPEGKREEKTAGDTGSQRSHRARSAESHP